MEWPTYLAIMLGTFLAASAIGVPIVYGFSAVNILVLYFAFGGHMLPLLALSAQRGVANFTYVAIPLFVLMGTVVFETGLTSLVFDSIDALIGRIPGRLAALTTVGGIIFGALTGSSMASCATVGSVMFPEMRRRGYDDSLALGSILSVGPLAVLIPPSALMVILGGISGISVAHLLVGGIVPGVLIGAITLGYIVLRATVDKSVAPDYEIEPMRVTKRLFIIAKNVLPLGLIVFLVVGTIYLGIATPSEAAAAGALGSFLLSAFYRKLNKNTAMNSLIKTAKVTGVVMFIMVGSVAFSQIMVMTGVTKGMLSLLGDLNLAPRLIIIGMLVIILFMGMFMEPVSIMFITVPIFVPIVRQIGIDLVWFGILVMIAIEIGLITPPFAMNIFALKAVSPPDVTIAKLYRAVMPFVGFHVCGLTLVILVPALATWLPGLMNMVR